MKKKFAAKYVFLAAALFLLSMGSCGKNLPSDEEITEFPTKALQLTQNPTPFPIEVTDITYYTLSEDLETVEVTSVLTGNVNMTPKELAEYVAGTMEDVSVIVELRDVTVEEENLIVDFESDSVPVCYAGSRLESAILDALSQSLLDNFSEYSGIIFRAGGAAYQSENRNFDLNYVYMGR